MVDDDQDDQEIFRQGVKAVDESINCIMFNSSEELMKALKKKHDNLPDFIFLDLNMPKISGLECLRNIKSISHYKNILVYVYSTSSTLKDINECREAGAVGFLVKPTSLITLKENLRKILKPG